MKKIILSLVAVAIAFATTNAQDKKAPTQKTPEQRTERFMTKLTEEYALTEEQKPKVKDLILKREQSRDELRKKYADDNNSFATEFKKANAEADKNVKALLTPEQIEHQKQYIEEARKRNKENAERRKLNPPPAPPVAPAATPAAPAPPTNATPPPAPGKVEKTPAPPPTAPQPDAVKPTPSNPK